MRRSRWTARCRRPLDSETKTTSPWLDRARSGLVRRRACVRAGVRAVLVAAAPPRRAASARTSPQRMSEKVPHDHGTVARPGRFPRSAVRWQARPMPRFTKAELAVVPRHVRARPARPRRAAAVRRDQPRPVDRRHPDPLRAPGEPLLPRAAQRRDHRPRRSTRRPAWTTTTATTSARAASASPTWSAGPPRGPTSSTPTSCARAAERLAALVAEMRPRVVAVAGITAYRARVRAEEGGARPPARGPRAAPQLWVVPNPSGLNAHATIATLADGVRRAGPGRGHPRRPG